MEETITTEPIPAAPQAGIVLTAEAQYYLNEGAGWAKFLGVMGFIICGFILLIAVFAGTIFSYAARLNPMMPSNQVLAGMGAVVGVIYGLIALLYFFPSLYIFQFGSKAKNGLRFGNEFDITTAISKLKSFFKFWGIMTIISIAFGLLGLIGVFAGMASLHNLHQA